MQVQDITTLYFDELLALAMSDAGFKCMTFEEYLKEQGIKISFKTLSAYRRGINVPSYERAKTLLDILGVHLTEQEIIDILARTRERIKSEKKYYQSDDTEIRKTITIRIKPKNIAEGISSYQGVRMLEERIEDLFGDENRFSDYVKMLILKDLREFVLEKKDINDIEERKDN